MFQDEEMTRRKTLLQSVALTLLLSNFSAAFAPVKSFSNSFFISSSLSAVTPSTPDGEIKDGTRRRLFHKSVSLIVAATVTERTLFPSAPVFAASGALIPDAKDAPKLQTYEDFTMTSEGWSFKDSKMGKDDVVAGTGDRVVFEWTGYTVGYFGRPFEAKGGPQGGAFDKDIDYSRTIIGSHTVVPALEQALMTMKTGGIRQVLIPYGPLSYPANDLEHTRVGPKPTTFSGQRALNFVLENPRVDRTLLINVKVIRVDKADGKGGYIRG